MTHIANRWMAHAALFIALTGLGTATLHAQVDTDAPSPGGGEQRAPGMGMGRGRGIRGTVVSASGTNVTLKTEAGDTWNVVATDNTRINLDRQPVKIADLKPGDEVMAMGLPDASKHELHALAVMGISAAQVAKLKADLGKTYIVGKITAIQDTRLVVLRPDKVSQTIELDDSTSIHRGGRLPAEFSGMGMGGGGSRGGGPRGDGPRGDGGRGRDSAGTPNETSGGNPNSGNDGEAITLADVKIGDTVGGTGTLKSGTFVPADLHVNTPRPRGPRADGSTPPPPRQ